MALPWKHSGPSTFCLCSCRLITFLCQKVVTPGITSELPGANWNFISFVGGKRESFQPGFTCDEESKVILNDSAQRHLRDAGRVIRFRVLIFWESSPSKHFFIGCDTCTMYTQHTHGTHFQLICRCFVNYCRTVCRSAGKRQPSIFDVWQRAELMAS